MCLSPVCVRWLNWLQIYFPSELVGFFFDALCRRVLQHSSFCSRLMNAFSVKYNLETNEHEQLWQNKVCVDQERWGKPSEDWSSRLWLLVGIVVLLWLLAPMAITVVATLVVIVTGWIFFFFSRHQIWSHWPGKFRDARHNHNLLLYCGLHLELHIKMLSQLQT